MKIKKGFMLCPVMGKTMAIATGELEKTFKGMIKMNESSVLIWQCIDKGMEPDEIYAEYAKTYGLDEPKARKDVDGIISKMTDAGIFE